MISESKMDNFRLFCQKAEYYGVCDKVTGDDKHKRIHMGLDEHSRVRYYGCLRRDSMKVFYRSDSKLELGILKSSTINVPTTESGFDYYSEIRPEDYDLFLNLVSSKLDRSQNTNPAGINTPMKPRNTIQNKDGLTMIVCGRCGKSFAKAPRCPDCGQLVKN